MENNEALSRLDSLISEIIPIYSKLCADWKQYANNNGIDLFNQKSIKVSDIRQNPRIMDSIKQYVDYLNSVMISKQFYNDDAEFTVNSRVKNVNSIDEKYDDYLNYKDEKGKVSINKCFNDLFGIRVIVNCDELSHLDIEDKLSKYDVMIENKGKKHIITSSRYQATHIYFKKDSQSYRWELQIWQSKNERENQESHTRHRFRYKEWESEI